MAIPQHSPEVQELVSQFSQSITKY